MIDLGSMTDKFSETGQNVTRRAIDLSRSHDHNFLSMMHFFAALAEVENALFVETMQAIGIDPQSLTHLLHQELTNSPVHVGRKMAIPDATRDLFNRALRRSRGQGRLAIESYDLFVALFTDQNGAPAELLRRLGVDPALGADTIAQRVRDREAEAESISHRTRVRFKQTFNFSDLTAESLNSIVAINEMGVTPDLWDKIDISLSEEDRQQAQFIVATLLNQSVALMNEPTIWARAIYPLLTLAEQGRLSAWTRLSLKAPYKSFRLEGIADGAIGHNIAGVSQSLCFVVVVTKRGPDIQNPQIQLYGAMLAAARMNWYRDNRDPQEIFGCYTVADSWIFMRGVVSNIDGARPTMTVSSSRMYTERNETETILRILKFITDKFAKELQTPPIA